MNYLENLHILKQAVEAEPAQLFNLSYFEQTTNCGTLHCTAGLATTLPHFQALGLYLKLPPFPMVHPSPCIDSLGGPEYRELDSALNHLFKPFPGADMGDGEGAFEYLFDTYGDGLWDSGIFYEHDLGDGMTHKDLAIARLDKAISLWEKA